MFESQSFGNKIRNLRIKLNLSQRRFGNKIGVSGKTISAYERGECAPSLKVLKDISSAYEVSIIPTTGVSISERICEIEKSLIELRRILDESLPL